MRTGRLPLWQAAASSLLLAGAAAWPASIRATGAAGSSAANINGYYAIENASQLNGKPVWVKQDVRAWSLWFLAGPPSYWVISDAACRDLCPKTNITYKLAQYDDPTQELGPWMVPTGPSIWEQDLLLEEGAWPQLVGIRGAAGANAGSINGNFSRSPTEVRNGKPVWISSDADATGWGIWYNANAGMWLLSSPAERSAGGTGGYMYKPVSEADPVRELGPWTVYSGTAWSEQTLAVRDLAIAEPTLIRVTGASGDWVGSINGYYRMHDTMRLGGRPVWVRAGKPNPVHSWSWGWSLWYFRRSGCWVITSATSRSAGNGDRNITYKPAHYDSPTQEDASWNVYRDPWTFRLQSVRFEEATWPERIRLDNASGKNGGYINGEFWMSPTEEVNGRPVWVLQDPTNVFNTTVGIWYDESSNQWLVSPQEAWRADRSEGWMWHPADEADPAREQPPWQVWNGSEWQPQMVVAWDPALPAQAGKAPIWPVSIRVTGATGSNAANINGYYALDNTTEVNGRPLWLKADADSGLGWRLLWWRATNEWLIRSRNVRLANSWVNIIYKVAQARLPTEQVSAWTVATASGPQEQAVRFEAASWPDQLRITGASGTYARSINGNFSRSPVEVRNGRPVWLLRTDSTTDQSALGIWYSAASGQWLLSPGSVRAGADPFGILQKAVTEADPTRESGPWWVNCGPQLCALPLVVRDPALPDTPTVQPAGQAQPEAASPAGSAQGTSVLGATATALICVFSILAGIALIAFLVWAVLPRKRAARTAVTAAPASEEAKFLPEYWTNRDPGRHFDEWIEIDQHTKSVIAALADATWKAQGKEPTCATEQTQDQCGGMPTGMEVIKVFRVESLTLWQRYSEARTHIFEQRMGECSGVEEIAGTAVRTEAQWDSRTLHGVNEVYLWVGATPSAATNICKDGFRLDLASNFPGAVHGTGVSLAEYSSRSDQRAGDDHTGPYKGVFCMLLCRVVLGNAFRIAGGGTGESNVQIDVESTMATKRFDSVVADQQAGGGTTSGREFVVYDPAQIYPEYVVLYLRKDKEAATKED